MNQLLLDDIEVARPERDRGVDLIAYIDLDEANGFVACPIQMKASITRSFSIQKKYDRFSRLLLVFVWGLAEHDQPEVYALTQAESLAVAGEMGWLETASWREGGIYSNTRPGVRLRTLLARYRMQRGAWKAKIRDVVTTVPL